MKFFHDCGTSPLLLCAKRCFQELLVGSCDCGLSDASVPALNGRCICMVLAGPVTFALDVLVIICTRASITFSGVLSLMLPGDCEVSLWFCVVVISLYPRIDLFPVVFSCIQVRPCRGGEGCYTQRHTDKMNSSRDFCSHIRICITLCMMFIMTVNLIPSHSL
jgi:hypothetical protein